MSITGQILCLSSNVCWPHHNMHWLAPRVHKRPECATPYPRVNYIFLKWLNKMSRVGMVTTLIFLRNRWILLFWSVPLIDIRSLCVCARVVIIVDVVSVCCGARALQFCLATMAWTPARHPIHSMRERTRMAIVDLGQSGVLLPWTTLQLSPRSFTMATQHVLGLISPAKRPAPLTYIVVSKCE